MAVFKKQGVFWIDYYVNRHRKRERIGPDKKLAATVLKKRKVEIAEGKFLDKQRPVTTTFDELAAAYLAYARRHKRSWGRDETSIKTLAQAFGGLRLTEITPASIEQYRASRRASISRHGRLVTPATVNRELACLKTMFNVALKGLIGLKGGVSPKNPAAAVGKEREHNERDRVLTADEFQRVYAAAARWLQPLLVVAYQTGMRAGEIRSLRWDQLDLTRGVICLKSSDTKTDEGRIVPLNPVLTSLFNGVIRHVASPYVFVNPAKLGTPDARYLASSVNHAFVKACRKAGVTGAVFHDLRHTFVTNARRAGIDYFTIMGITGHKTMAVFKRYNSIDEADLRRAMRQIDTYMDTGGGEAARDPLQVFEKIHAPVAQPG